MRPPTSFSGDPWNRTPGSPFRGPVSVTSAIESRVVHPVHWLTAALRLEDGTRIVMPAFDRPVWTYTRPSGQDIRALRTEMHRRRQAGRGRR